MRALPLWQPWAHLIAIEAKRIETRHWPAPPALVGERIAIFASKTLRVTECRRDPFRQYVPRPHDLPTSAIVCTAVLDRCEEITPELAGALRTGEPEEFAFGNYNVYLQRRWAWHLRDVQRLEAPVPWKWPFQGPAKFFDVPDDLSPLAAEEAAKPKAADPVSPVLGLFDPDLFEHAHPLPGSTP